ncbi:hypothetical protein BDN70DRAFT_897979 [Pholiota conissans]|uniref:Uncharacterized protein n=1 Tax=Pholiota conissans TaxID=109636 RepID=A0A9P6CQC8_9AGAR|nr:hypothetical protein BDN70DRAFT_897979 [Pholiota conissans]
MGALQKEGIVVASYWSDKAAVEGASVGGIVGRRGWWALCWWLPSRPVVLGLAVFTLVVEPAGRHRHVGYRARSSGVAVTRRREVVGHHKRGLWLALGRQR